MSDDPIAMEKTYYFFNNYPGIDLKINTVDYISIPNTDEAKCWQCNNQLEYPFYWLKWEEGTKFGCRKCVEEITTLEGHYFKYERNSILLMGKWKKLAVKNFGANTQPIHPKHINNYRFFSCDGCNKVASHIKKARYICLGCRMDPNPYTDGYIDFCEKCFTKAARK